MEGLLLKAIIEDKKIKEIIPLKIEISELFQPYFSKHYYLKIFEDEQKQNFISSKASFLEINLSKMKIRAYQDGSLTKEFPILAKGDPDFWAGTPYGNYEVVSKQKIAFSSAADVYMPWSINIYGKYYIHGQPYYMSGVPTNFDYTGGCIRVSNESAEAIYNLAVKKMPVLIIKEKSKIHNYKNFSQNIELIPEISAKAYLVADLDNGYVFSEKTSQKRLPIASLTKLMTAIVTAENINLKKSILIRQGMLNVYGSTKGLTAGKRFRIIELFHPLLIESSNGATEALSYFLGRNGTIKLMNEKAKAIGMKNTNFSDPSGLSSNNISTAQDLWILSRYLLKTRLPILKITKGEKVESFGGVNFEDLENKNIFFEEENFIGGKSGYILASEYTGIFIFRFNDKKNREQNIAIILLGSEDIEKDARQALVWLKEKYSMPD